MVKKNTNSLIKKVTQSEIALFVALIFAFGNLLTFLDNNDLGGIILFFIVAFLIMMKSKNMVIVLGGAIFITNITVLILKNTGLSLNHPVGIESFSTKDSKDSTGLKKNGNDAANQSNTNKTITSNNDSQTTKSNEQLSSAHGKKKKKSERFSKLTEKLISNSKGVKRGGSSQENIKVAQEALTKLEPLMDRAEGLMSMFTSMGGGSMIDQFLGGGEEDDE